MQRSSSLSYYQADGLGSITSLSNSGGTLASTYTYDSFGKMSNSTGTLSNPFLFTAREFDTETGAYAYRARYYNQEIGRFTTEDPLRFYAGLNFYTYVDNAPTVLIDPYGLYTCVGNAVCNFTPDMNEALLKLEKCLRHDIRITCGNDSHGPKDPHTKGLAIDIGYGSNPWLTRDAILKCFKEAFPSDSYAQQEYNDDTNNPAKYHYHMQYTPGKGGATGFSPYIHEHGK